MPYFIQEHYRIEVGKIICVDSDGGDDHRFCIKPASSITRSDQAIEIPSDAEELGFRMMLAAAVGERISARRRHKMASLMGFGAALDIYDVRKLKTARKNGLPWAEAKGSDTFCPISDFTPVKDIDDPYDLEVYLEVNGEEVIKGSTKDRRIDMENVLERVTRSITLYPGDLICVPVSDEEGFLSAGDSIEAGISSVGVLRHIVKSTSSATSSP
ncbi:MAG: fumarylacetoacetate hydrolase family protein [Thermoplasmatota archaeon]